MERKKLYDYDKNINEEGLYVLEQLRIMFSDLYLKYDKDDLNWMIRAIGNKVSNEVY